MASNSIGRIFRLTTFGESHGEAIGGVVDGCPAGLFLDLEKIQAQLDRRRPGQSNIVSQRKEADKVIFLSGIFEGRTTGTPIGFIIKNENSKSADYEHLRDVFRPSHADYTYFKKYGIRDYRGGGRSSARETAVRVVGGAIAQQFLKDVKIHAFVSQIGDISLDLNLHKDIESINFANIEKTAVRCPDLLVARQMEELILSVRKSGDTIGGVVTCIITGVPAGLGEPVFDKLHAQLAKAIMSINAAKGFEIGSGFMSARMRGSEHNDIFNIDGSTQTNFSGGVQGGISNGMPIYFRVAFKPVATLMRSQQTINSKGEKLTLQGKGRHDPCVLPRAVPIVEAMAALTIADFLLIQECYKPSI